MRADLAVGDLLAVEQFHQEAARYINEIGSLLRRQFSTCWNERNSVTFSHFIEQIDQQAYRRERQLDSFVLILRKMD